MRAAGPADSRRVRATIAKAAPDATGAISYGVPAFKLRRILVDPFMPTIRFQAKVTAIGSQTILRVPKAASSKLPSRGMSMVEGTFNGHAFQTPLEPDGMGSHWFRVSNTMLRAASVEAGDSVSVALVPMALWPEPRVPADLAQALASDPQVRAIWLDITPLSRWDWIRWIGSTRNRDTRMIRIE